MKRKILLVAIALISCICMYADYTQVLPLNYEDFFRADAIDEDGEHLERGAYTEGALQNSEASPILADQWNLTGKEGSRGRSNPAIENSTLSWGAYVDNMKGKAFLYDGTLTDTRVSIYSLKRNNDYSSEDGSKSYYLAALVNLSKVGSTGGVEFLSFDGNYTSTTSRARVSAKKNADGGYHIGMEYAATSTESGTTWSSVLAYNETHLIIVKITPNTDKYTDNIESAKLWLDPDLSKSEAENAALVSVTGKGIGSIRGINIVQKKNLTGKLAGLRFSDNWEDVAMPESAQERVVAKLDDGTWGDMLPSGESYSGGSYPTVAVNGLEMHAAGLQETNNKIAENDQVVKNRICLDNGSRNSMVILPTVANIMQINVYAAAGGDSRDIKLQRWDNATSAWIDVATYSCTTKNVCYFFTTTLNRNDATKLRLVNASTAGGVYVWKIETFPVVTLSRIVTDFNDNTWGEAAASYTQGSYPTSIINEFELNAAGLQTGSIDYLPTYKRLTKRISMDKDSNGGMITLPSVTSVTQIDVYANSGSPDRYINLQKYNYSNDIWENIESWHCETTDCYRFSKTLDSSAPTRLRIVNADGSTKYIYKVVTYPSAPTQLEIPEALEATNVVAHSFTAKWNMVTNASGYRIAVFNYDGSRKTAIEVTGGNTFQCNVSGLDAGTSYTYKVAAIGDDSDYVDSYLSDAIAVTTAAEITDTYTRTVTNGSYGTICLPKAAPDLSDAGAVFFEVAGKIMDGSALQEVVFDEVTSLEAGVPYIFLAEADELNIQLTGDAVSEAGSANGLIGSFTVAKVGSSNNNFILSDNKLYCTKNQVYYVGENRAYFKVDDMSEYSGAAPAPGRRRVVMHAAEEQVATALDELTTTNSCCKIVRNGQIIIIRNGVQFDVTGRQIK